MVETFEDMYNRFDRIPACDRRTDRQTDEQTTCHGIVRAMHTRRAVMTMMIVTSMQQTVNVPAVASTSLPVASFFPLHGFEFC